ncbi:methyltransferase domain-containing protein [Desulforamulus ruminis]|uniref:Methyltransferase type 11 n=1 Tax=Desulforamulus ruminis (strain ATCC 23193 / DSM 2154 / NCIMB 8452 / DL) TaxID=696281 RepID=F6DP39_DESRL|nr:methyltransferase domain-containing protein [Desulforamulus ruminis]AEG61868.1 Methyltransferase type 11 [Desulforamulus ruminis DSM 2154]
MNSNVPKLNKDRVLNAIYHQFGEKDGVSIDNNIIELKQDVEAPLLKIGKKTKNIIIKNRFLYRWLYPIMRTVKSRIPQKYLYSDATCIDANELLKYNESEFVIRCYETILNRIPEEEGFNYYLNSLITRKLSKVLIINSIIQSEEAKTRNFYVINFKLKKLKAQVAHYVYKTPVFGHIAKAIMHMLRLPKEISHISRQFYYLRQEQCALRLQLDTYRTEMLSNAEILNNKIDLLNIDIKENLSNLEMRTKTGLCKLSTEADYRLNKLSTEINSELEELRSEAENKQNHYVEDIDRIQTKMQELINRTKTRSDHTDMTAIKGQDLDAYYLAFENKYRGTIEDIKQRQTFYLPRLDFINKASRHLIVDIGCGRGEWLKLLKDNGYTAIGVDLNKEMIKKCINNGLNVTLDDAIEYLKGCEDESIDAVTGFQIIEHLGTETLHQLAIEVKRCLKPGGMFLFETPNPESIYVGTTFYTDFTHNKPLPPDSIKFLFDYYGFGGVEIIRTGKKKEPHYIAQEYVDEVVWRYNMEQDYAVVGYRL